MSQVSIKVGPKTYTIVTADGEEAKITALGEVIDKKYQLLGNSRSVQETDNLVFASLFLADELEENRKTVEEADARIDAADREVDKVKAEMEKLRAEFDEKIASAVAEAKQASETALREATASVEHEKERSGGKKAELRAEIETLRKAEARAREENRKLKAELADLHEAAREQHDLFGGDEPDEKTIETLEALAAKAEQAADALESGGLEGGAGAD